VIGAGGLVISIIVFAVGAILDWAVTEPYQHGFIVNKVGWILMTVGIVGALISNHRDGGGEYPTGQTAVDDGQGTLSVESIRRIR
jgi:hypothetical protein